MSLFTSDHDEGSFVMDLKAVYAVARALEVIGEAVKRVPAEVRARYPQVPWSDMARMRDKLIHGYFGVDDRVLWKAAQREIPPIRRLVAEVLERERGPKG